MAALEKRGQLILLFSEVRREHALSCNIDESHTHSTHLLGFMAKAEWLAVCYISDTDQRCVIAAHGAAIVWGRFAILLQLPVRRLHVSTFGSKSLIHSHTNISQLIFVDDRMRLRSYAPGQVLQMPSLL